MHNASVKISRVVDSSSTTRICASPAWIACSDLLIPGSCDEALSRIWHQDRRRLTDFGKVLSGINNEDRLSTLDLHQCSLLAATDRSRGP